MDEVDGKDGEGKNLEHRLLIELRQSFWAAYGQFLILRHTKICANLC